MKILSIQILYAVPQTADSAVPVAGESNLSSYAFYMRSSIQEFINFFSRTVAERTAAGQRQSVQKEAYTAHVYARASDNLVGVLTTDHEYPVRVAFSLLNKILDEFVNTFSKATWEQRVQQNRASKSRTPPLLEWPALKQYLEQYQDPSKADTIMKVQQELDETKIVIHKTIDSVLQRGEQLDVLMQRSSALSRTSEEFYKTAKNQNSCCVVM